MGAEAEHGITEDARLRAESRRCAEGRGADRNERTEAECYLGEQGATNGGEDARQRTDASHDAGQEHETAGEAAHGSEDRAEHGRVHGVDELESVVQSVEDYLRERLHRFGEVNEQLTEVLRQIAHARQDVPRRLQEIEQSVGADERLRPVGKPLAGVDQPVRELLGERAERIDEVPQPLDRVLDPDADGVRVLLGVAADSSKPLCRTVGREPGRPHDHNVGEVLAGVLEERGERLGVPSHDHLKGVLEAGEQSVACALLDLGDLSLELAGVVDPRYGRLAERVSLGLPLLDGFLLRRRELVLGDRQSLLGLVVLLDRVLQPGEREHERGETSGGAGSERGNAAEAGNDTTEGRHGRSAGERHRGEHRVEDTERLSGLRHRDGGVLDLAVELAHLDASQVNGTPEVSQPVLVDIDLDVNVLAVKSLSGLPNGGDLSQSLTLGDVDADLFVADRIERHVDSHDIVVDAIRVQPDFDVLGVLAEGFQLSTNALVVLAVEIDIDIDLNVAHPLRLDAELFKRGLGPFVIDVDLKVDVLEDPISVPAQSLQLRGHLLVTGQLDLGDRSTLLVLVEPALDALEVAVRPVGVDPNMRLGIVEAGEIVDQALDLIAVAIQRRVPLNGQLLLLAVSASADLSQLAALAVLGLVHRAVALTCARGIPSLVDCLALALLVVDPASLSVGSLLGRVHLGGVALSLDLHLTVTLLEVVDLLGRQTLDSLRVPLSDLAGGTLDVPATHEAHARALDRTELFEVLLESPVGAFDVTGIALAGLGERGGEEVNVFLDGLSGVPVLLAEVVERLRRQGLTDLPAHLADSVTKGTATDLLVNDFLDILDRGGGTLGDLFVDILDHALDVLADLLARLLECRRERVLNGILELSEDFLVLEGLVDVIAELRGNVPLDVLEAGYDLHERRTSAIHPSHCNLFLSPAGPACASRPPCAPWPLFVRGHDAACRPSAFRSKSP